MGASNNVLIRWNRHRHELRRGVHSIPKFQELWDKHGEDNFLFEIHEEVSHGLKDRENYWIGELKPTINRAKFSNARDSLREKKEKKVRVRKPSKMKICPEKRAKMTERLRKTISLTSGKILEERKRKLSESHKGQIQTEDQNIRRGIALAGKYRFISPAGDVIDIFNMRKFCRENDLNAGIMNLVWNGHRKSHKGWRRAE